MTMFSGAASFYTEPRVDIKMSPAGVTLTIDAGDLYSTLHFPVAALHGADPEIVLRQILKALHNVPVVYDAVEEDAL